MKTIRCTLCLSEFTDEEIKDACECLNCHTSKPPMAIKEDVNITVNWHHLRILTNYAWNFASGASSEHSYDMKKVLNTIFKVLYKFKPEGAAALTLEEEIKDLQDDYPGAELFDSQGKNIVKKKTIH